MSSHALGALLTGRSFSRDQVDWNELLCSAVNERVAAALSPLVRDDDSVPPDARQAFASEAYRSGAFNLLLYRELGRLLEGAPVAEPPIVLKGGALAATVYDDLAHRPMSDLDVLVRYDDVSVWARALEGLGYERVSPEMASGLSEAIHYQLGYRGGPHNEIVIEIHWNLIGGDADWRSPDVDWFWQHTTPWPGVPELGCPPALQLSTIATIAYASAHAILQHGGARTRLLWLYDIHRVIESLEQGPSRRFWAALIDQARELDWDAAVAEALERSRALFGTPVPKDILASLRTNARPHSREHAARRAELETSRAEHVLDDFRCLDLKGRARLALAILFPSPTYMRWRYPSARTFWPLAYPYRWGVVTREGAIHLARRLTRALPFVCL